MLCYLFNLFDLLHVFGIYKINRFLSLVPLETMTWDYVQYNIIIRNLKLMFSRRKARSYFFYSITIQTNTNQNYGVSNFIYYSKLFNLLSIEKKRFKHLRNINVDQIMKILNFTFLKNQFI